MKTTKNVRSLFALAFKAAALGMAALAIAFTAAGFASTELHVIVLAVGLGDGNYSGPSNQVARS